MLLICFVFLMLSRLFIAALWSPAGKGLTSKHLFAMSNCDFVTFPCGILGQVWYSIVLIPDLCRLSYFVFTSMTPAILLLRNKSKTEGKYQESIQSSTTPDPGHHMGK